MKIFKCIISVFMLCLGAGCSHVNQTKHHDEYSLAVLTDYHIDNGFITISTTGNGCTFYYDFKVQASNFDSNTLEVVRIGEDKCNLAPRDVSLTYGIKHTGLSLDKEIHVRNLLPQGYAGNVSVR